MTPYGKAVAAIVKSAGYRIVTNACGLEGVTVASGEADGEPNCVLVAVQMNRWQARHWLTTMGTDGYVAKHLEMGLPIRDRLYALFLQAGFPVKQCRNDLILELNFDLTKHQIAAKAAAPIRARRAQDFDTSALPLFGDQARQQELF